ncbi:MAG: DUF4445 domain-containing protein [Acidimicrobiaceae bacterium]|nr:DUF4445 domain-containing protein [Acidimicrobiaceae bacterium]
MPEPMAGYGNSGKAEGPASHLVIFEPPGIPIESIAGETVLESARRTGIRLVAACGGRGTCRSCYVRVLEGTFDGGEEGDAQRACQIRPISSITVELSARSLSTPERTEVAGTDVPVELAPIIRAVDVSVVPPSLEDRCADAERLAIALEPHGVKLAPLDLEVLHALPLALRRQQWSGTALLSRDTRLVAFAASGTSPLGLAVDFGTTNVAGYLVDLATGRRLAGRGIENLQAGFGSDVVTRITYATRSETGHQNLVRAARQTLSMLTQALCESAKAKPADIVDIVICGNTVMHHLFLGLPVGALGAAPFVAAASGALDFPASELGLGLAPGCFMHLLPGIGGYVGGDHVAALLATRHHHVGGVSLILDIGTNTEISLLREQDEIISISTPSGPALEGGHIACGMRAGEGAVEGVREDGSGGFALTTIGGVPPVGLCGSGVLDAVAAMFRSGAIDRRGRISPDGPATVQLASGRAVKLADPDLFFTQDDIRSVQLAKAAIRAGVDLLLEEGGVGEQEVNRVIVAGAFGAYIDLESTVAIGLLPDIPLERYIQVGNAAGVGARLALLSADEREEAIRLAKRARVLELSGLPQFQKVFFRRIGF